jgi:hypothetical protein
VKHILNDDGLQLIGSAQVAAGGGPLLSEEEGSSISYESSPVKIVKVGDIIHLFFFFPFRNEMACRGKLI